MTENHHPEDDDDWITITDEEEEEEQVNCHEIIGAPAFDMPANVAIDPCAICFENIDQMINVVVNRCGHSFHASCMFEALEHGPGCPMCRCQLVQFVDSEEEDEDYEDEVEEGEEEDEDEDEEGEEEDDVKTWLKFHEDFVLHYQDMLNHYVGMLIHYQQRNQPEDVLRQQTVHIPKTIEDIKRHTEEVIKHKQLLAAAARQ